MGLCRLQNFLKVLIGNCNTVLSKNMHDNKQHCSGLTVGLWDSDSTKGSGFGQTREGPWKQTIVMVADSFRFWLFSLFFHVHGGQSFSWNWKVWRKTSATHSSASRPRSTPGWLLHLEIQFCLDLKRLNKNCLRRFRKWMWERLWLLDVYLFKRGTGSNGSNTSLSVNPT